MSEENAVLVEKCSDQKVRNVWDEKACSSNEVDGTHVRRHSASPLFGPNRKAGVPSRYRGGASIGSCHDSCKFGHKSIVEEKPKSFMKKTPSSRNGSGGKGQKKIACSADNGKRSVVRKLSFRDVTAEKERQMHDEEATHSGEAMPKAKEKPETAESTELVKERDGWNESQIPDEEATHCGEAISKAKEKPETAESTELIKEQDGGNESQMPDEEATHSGEAIPKAKEKPETAESPEIVIEQEGVYLGVNEPQMRDEEAMLREKGKPESAESPEIVKEQEGECLGGDEEKPCEVSINNVRKIKVAKNKEKPTGLVSATLRSKTPVRKAGSLKDIVHRDKSRSSYLNNHPTRRKQEERVKLREDMPEKILYMIEPNGKSTPAQTSHKAPLHEKRLLKTQGSKATKNGSDDSHLAKSLLPPLNKSLKSKKEKLEDTEPVLNPNGTFHGYRKSKSSIKEAISYTPKLRPGAPKAKQNGRRDSHLIKSLLLAVDEPGPSHEDELLAGIESVLAEPSGTMSRDTETKTRASKAKTSIPRSISGTLKAKQDVEPKSKAIRGLRSKGVKGEGLGSVWKMKFRRGKVISLPSGNNSPVKLKFRKHRSFSGSRLSDNVGDTNYKNIEVDGAHSHKDRAEPAKVVLRRHEATQKKDDVDLNNVVEMKFRRGKVISLPSGNNSPVKLKFRKHRGFSDSHLSENVGDANYKNREVDGVHSQKDREEPVKVVLRRHEATQKKDDVDLNNVIEETASELVKTRKSKVKALVGAFETVMSLRDLKA